MKSEVLAAMAGVLAGGVVSGIAFFFRWRKEKLELLNSALFYLLEVWKTLAMVCLVHSDAFSDAMIRRFRVKFPAEPASTNEKKVFSEMGMKALPYMIGASTGQGRSISLVYEESVMRLAPIYPVMAFELKTNVFLIGYLHGADKLLESEPQPEFVEEMLKNAKSEMYADTLKELEKDLRFLARRSGISSWHSIRRITKRINERLRVVPDEPVDFVLDTFIAPLIDKHYSDLGVKNPNKQ